MMMTGQPKVKMVGLRSISIACMLDWILRTDYGLDGDSLSYEDRLERREVEEQRRAKERQLMEEGR